MTPDEARSAVYSRFLDQWDDRTVVALEGREDDNSEPGPDVRWVRLSVRNLGGGQLTLGPTGGRKYRREASAFVQVFTPSSKGMGPGATLAHEARAILEGTTITVGTERVEFYDGTIREIPLGAGEKSLQVNVEVRFSYDETK